jgi:hypothetical protein
LGSEEKGRSGVIVVIRQLCQRTDRVRTCVIELLTVIKSCVRELVEVIRVLEYQKSCEL